MTLSVFPDVNVWLALTTPAHIHHEVAKRWFESLDDADLLFCRFTQISLLRLLTTAAVMGRDVLHQREAWQAYDRFLAGGVRFLEEPPTLEDHFRRLTRHSSSSPKEWADAYLAAFAIGAGLHLATFDKALAAKAKGSLLLR
jgi:toxin-antitoxin system PIN domain toxin